MSLSSAVVGTFLIAIGGNGVASEFIIKDTQPNYLEDDKSTISKFHNAYQKIYTELYSYRELKNNWDGYGGVRPADEIIITTKNFIDILKSYSKFHNAYQKIYTELYSYRELKNNWDGYGGVRPADEIIITTKNFIDILKNSNIINPKIMVSGVGEIGLFWKNKNSYIEVDFDGNEYFTYFYKIDNKIYGEDDIPLNQNIPDRLLHVLKNLQNQNSTKNSSSLIGYSDSTTSNSLTV